MAKRVQVILEDDLDGSEADETVSFALDGAAYEIDLSADHANELRETLARFVGHARKADNSVRTPRPGRPRSAARIDREQIKAIRDWARRNGHPVSERGRVAAHIVDAYNTAHAS
jgi:hypothetical protein